MAFYAMDDTEVTSNVMSYKACAHQTIKDLPHLSHTTHTHNQKHTPTPTVPLNFLIIFLPLSLS